MIEEQRPSTVKFKLYGPNAGKTAIYGGFQFFEGLLKVNKEESALMERALRPYAACLESEWDARQAEFKKGQAETPLIPAEPLSQGDAIAQAVAEALVKQGEQFEQEMAELVETLEQEKEVAIAEAVAQAAADAVEKEVKKVPDEKAKAGAKENGASNDKKDTK